MNHTRLLFAALLGLAAAFSPAPAAAGPELKKYMSQKKDLEAALALYRAGDNRRALPAFEKLEKKGNPLGGYYKYTMLEEAETAPARKADLAARGAAFIPAVRTLAEQGAPAAQNLLGNLLLSGARGVTKNAAESAEWFAKAAAQGYAPAQCNLGLAYAAGEGVAKNAGTAVDWFRKAADQGSAAGQTRLGTAYLTGEGVKADPAEALKWFTLAAEQGLPQAQFQLGYAKYSGQGTAQDFPGAFAWFYKAADKGHAYAQFFVGLAYAVGRGTEKNPQEAFNWYRKAAVQGHDIAQLDLSSFYADGFGTERDPQEAAQWAAKAALQGYGPAQNRLGEIYLRGALVPRDMAQAVRWLRLAAAKGEGFAMFTLGKIYQNGDGVEKDPEQALAWYAKAAGKNWEGAQAALAALKKEEDGFTATFKRWGRLARRKLPGRAVKEAPLADEKTGGLLPPPGTDLGLWKIGLLPSGMVSHVLPPEFAAHKTRVLDPNPGITRQFVYETADGLAAVLIVTKIRAELPKDDSLLDKSKADNEALLKAKGAELVALRDGELAGRRFTAMSALNWDYGPSFPHAINLGAAPAGDRPAAAGDTAVFVRDGFFIEAALHRRSDGKLPRADLLAGLQDLSRRWLESVRVQAGN